MKNKQRSWPFAAVLAVVVVASIAARNRANVPSTSAIAHPGAEPSLLPETLDGAFKQFVDGAIFKNAQSTSLDEWESSGATPADIFANAEARKTDRKKAFNAYCKALRALPDSKLALFQNLLVDPKARPLMHCAAALSERLDTFWKSRAAVLRTEIEARKTQKAGMLAESPTLATRAIQINPARGEQLNGRAGEGYLRENEFAITLAGGPSPRITREVLNSLKAYNVRANFFNGDQTSRRWPDLVKAELAEGHVVGSRSMSRARKTDMHSAEVEIKQTHKAVADVAPSTAPFFRFPIGSPTEVLGTFLKQQRMTAIQWSIDSLDWKLTDPVELYHHQLRELEKARGGIILLHDNRRQTAITLPYVLEEIRGRGWQTAQFVPQ